MSGQPADLADRAARIRAAHEARARAEIAAADSLAPGSDAIRSGGSLIPEVALLKGLPGPAEVAGGEALSGADGAAAAKALERLGYDPGVVFRALTRPEPGIDESSRAARLRALIEAIDAPIALALDAEAAHDLAAAFGLGGLSFGRTYRVAGRRLVAVEGLEASLSDERLKARVWRQLQAAAPEGPAY